MSTPCDEARLEYIQGFGWDSNTLLPTASPLVWMSYIEAHPLVKKFQHKTLLPVSLIHLHLLLLLSLR